MAEEKNKFSPPKSKKMNDYVLSVIKSALGIIPYAGTGINELLGYLVQPSLQKRKEKWFEFIGLSLEDIINRVKKLEDITSNENFIDVAIKASVSL
ncbi:MAG: hypothetical protein LBW85_00940 [Deltaproteobacteria bacterium]|jgi:hypothetical protein|nr:hypothetical protein [Deltaproteobacteria bacterium]